MSLFMPGLLQKVLMTLTFYVSIFSWQQIIYIFRPQCKCCLCDQNFSMIYMFRKPLYAVSYPTLLKLIKQVIIEKIRTSWGTCEGIKKKKKKSEQIQGVKQFAYFFMQWPVGCSHICWSLLDIYIYQSSGPTFYSIYYFKSITSSECFRNWYTLHIVEYLMFVYYI